MAKYANNCLTLISQLVRECQGVQHTPLPHENMWISRLLIELQSSPKNQKNPHDQLIWGGNTFQSSIYHRFSLKPDFVFFSLNTLSLWISRLLNELQSSSKNKNNPQNLLIWGGDTFQSSIYHSFPLKPGCVNKICSIKMLITPSIFLWFS